MPKGKSFNPFAKAVSAERRKSSVKGHAENVGQRTTFVTTGSGSRRKLLFFKFGKKLKAGAIRAHELTKHEKREQALMIALAKKKATKAKIRKSIKNIKSEKRQLEQLLGHKVGNRRDLNRFLNTL